MGCQGLLSRSRSCISLGVPPANAAHTQHILVSALGACCRMCHAQICIAAAVCRPLKKCGIPGSLLLSQLGIQLPDVCSVSAENCLRLM